MHITHTLGFLENLGAPELLIILFIILLLFGAKKLPELAHSLGKSVREFKKAASEADDEIKSAVNVNEPKKTDSGNGKTVPVKKDPVG